MVEIPRTQEQVVESVLFESSQPLTLVQIEEVTGIGEDELKPILLAMKDRNEALMNARFRWRLTNEHRTNMLGRCNVDPNDFPNIPREPPSAPTRKGPPLSPELSVVERAEALQAEAENRIAQIPQEIALVEERCRQHVAVLREEQRKLVQLTHQLGGTTKSPTGTLSGPAGRILTALQSAGKATVLELTRSAYGDDSKTAAASQVLRTLMQKGLVNRIARGLYEVV